VCVGCYVATLALGYASVREGFISLTTFVMFAKVTLDSEGHVMRVVGALSSLQRASASLEEVRVLLNAETRNEKMRPNLPVRSSDPPTCAAAPDDDDDSGGGGGGGGGGSGGGGAGVRALLSDAWLVLGPMLGMSQTSGAVRRALAAGGAAATRLRAAASTSMRRLLLTTTLTAPGLGNQRVAPDDEEEDSSVYRVPSSCVFAHQVKVGEKEERPAPAVGVYRVPSSCVFAHQVKVGEKEERPAPAVGVSPIDGWIFHETSTAAFDAIHFDNVSSALRAAGRSGRSAEEAAEAEADRSWRGTSDGRARGGRGGGGGLGGGLGGDDGRNDDRDEDAHEEEEEEGSRVASSSSSSEEEEDKEEGEGPARDARASTSSAAGRGAPSHTPLMALEDITLSLPLGRVYGIIGEIHGTVGTSLFLDLVSRQALPTRGAIRVPPARINRVSKSDLEAGSAIAPPRSL
jgi:ABC-type multidrug transport system fused ATPase/permease subunit